MILVGNQRGGAKNLALHLLKEENDHVRVHELRGFASDNLVSALNESYAISRGTQCRQHLFSLSLNPPPDKHVSTEDFEETINRAESELGLTGQPRAIVFHEKAGPGGMRRHAHAVWSRINADEMKAIQLSHTKRKLVEFSRQQFIERQWHMPRGLMASEERDVRNFSLAEWQQAKRADKDASKVKAAFQECWAVSDSRPAFSQALDSRGYKLARGDRRGFVAVDMHGEVYAVAKWVGIKTKEVRTRLGPEEDSLPSVENRKSEFAAQIAERLKALGGEEERKEREERTRIEAERKALVERQRAERTAQNTAIDARWMRDAEQRQLRFNRGLRGLVDRLSGKYTRLRNQNIAEAHQAMQRDRAQKDRLIFEHVDECRQFERRVSEVRRLAQERKVKLDADIRRYEAARAVTTPARPISPVRKAAAVPKRETRREVFTRVSSSQNNAKAPQAILQSSGRNVAPVPRRLDVSQQIEKRPHETPLPARELEEKPKEIIRQPDPLPVPSEPDPIQAPAQIAVPIVESDRETRREAFMRKRADQVQSQKRDHSRRWDFDR